MASDDRARWNQAYRERVLRAYPPPDALLVAYAPPVEKGHQPPQARQPLLALDLAAGICQNTIYLAELGYLVTAMDISHVALERGRAEMAMRNLRNINFIQADLDAVRLKPDAYDLICVFRYLNRDFFPVLRRALRPGGMVIYQTYNIRRLEYRPDATKDYLLALRELPTFFPGWDVLHDDDVGDMSRFVARKPGAA